MKITLPHLALAAMVGLVACDEGRSPADHVSLRSRMRTTPQLQSFDSCSDLLASLQTSLSEQMRVQLLQAQEYNRLAVGDAAGGADAPAEAARQEGVDYSGTNNQEAGVDESDFVKTDGFHIYLLNGRRLEILGVPQFGELVPESSTELEGWPFQMLLAADRLVVFSSINTWDLPEAHPLRAQIGAQETNGWWYPSSSLVKLTVLDVSNRNAPSAVRQLYLEGWFQTARRVESSVRLLTYGMMEVPGLAWWPVLPEEYWSLPYGDPRRQEMWDNAVQATIAANDALIAATGLDDFVPRLIERVGSTFTPHPFAGADCSSFKIADDGVSRGITSILSLDLLGDAFDADHIVSNWSVAYASTDTLIVAEPAADWWWYWGAEDFEEATNIHRFDISVPGQTRYTGSGRVKGHAFDQFRFSEHEGRVRVATTSGASWWWENVQPVLQNHVFVLEGETSLEITGELSGIAPEESLWASRFVGDRAYLVTFRSIDPLWVVDLSGTQPRILGELEVAGVSTYIHPLTGHLLTIGYGGDATGIDWSTQISLFDVTDESAPVLEASLNFAPPSAADGWSGAWSEAQWEHKAFQYWAPRGLLAIPLSTYRYDYNSGFYEYRSRLELLRVDENGVTDAAPLAVFGEIDHSNFFNSDPSYYWEWRDVRRSIFMGDFIYALSDRGVTAHSLTDLSLAASVELPGSSDPYYWWY